MSLVDFEAIIAVPQSAGSAINGAVNTAQGPIVAGNGFIVLTSDVFAGMDGDYFAGMNANSGFGGRTTLYDPDWGYFLFGQSLRTEYHDTQTYMDVGEFTIQGEFTANAEDAVAGGPTANDDAQFQRMIRKYVALETKLETAAKALAPANFADWGTAADPRCVTLPQPLVDSAGNPIYAMPLEINIEPGQWGRYIRYTATLREAKFPSAKVTIDVPNLGQVFLDDGILTISPPRPIISRTALPGCCGEIIQVQNFTTLEVGIQGTLNGTLAPGRSINDSASDLIRYISTDKINIGITRSVKDGVEYDLLWQNMSLDDNSGLEVDVALQTVGFDLRTKSGKVI